jgi:hypothetical protein
MKYAITGHTEGIGNRLYSILSPYAIGFSRANGYDINKKECRDKIINESKDYDVFINNANSSFGQTYLLLDLINAWKNDPNKKIINVGSRICEIILPPNRLELLQYQAEKTSLKSTVEILSNYSDIKCEIVYKSFGYVGTEKILKRYPNFTKDDYISLDKACEIILL